VNVKRRAVLLCVEVSRIERCADGVAASSDPYPDFECAPNGQFAHAVIIESFFRKANAPLSSDGVTCPAMLPMALRSDAHALPILSTPGALLGAPSSSSVGDALIHSVTNHSCVVGEMVGVTHCVLRR